MAEIYLSSVTGQSVTARLYDNATPVGTAISMTEIGTTGEYFCDVTSGTAAGDYLVIFFVGGQSIGSGQLYWDGTGETVPGLEDIRVKTDSLTFTVPNVLDANIQYVNDIEVKGTGEDNDPWNPV